MSSENENKTYINGNILITSISITISNHVIYYLLHKIFAKINRGIISLTGCSFVSATILQN